MAHARASAGEALPQVLARLVGSDVRVAGAAVPAQADALPPEEAAAVAGAVPLRRSEFACGRRLARGLLAGLGWPEALLPVGVGRAPRWPDGAVGSITHAGGWCLVAVARRESTAGLGIDLEPDEPLEPELAGVLLTPRERAGLPAWGLPAERALRLVFCLKEALFKAQHPLSGVVVEPSEAEVEPAGPGAFLARLEAGPFRRDQPLGGRWANPPGWLLAAVRLPPGPSPLPGSHPPPRGPGGVS